VTFLNSDVGAFGDVLIANTLCLVFGSGFTDHCCSKDRQQAADHNEQSPPEKSLWLQHEELQANMHVKKGEAPWVTKERSRTKESLMHGIDPLPPLLLEQSNERTFAASAAAIPMSVAENDHARIEAVIQPNDVVAETENVIESHDHCCN